MASGWFYSKRGAAAGPPEGPFTWQQLYSLAQAGVIGPDDLVWNQQLPVWQPAAQVPGLFAASMSPEAAAPASATNLAGAQAKPQCAYEPAAQAASLSAGRRSRLWGVVVPIIAVIVVGGILGAYFGFFRDNGGGIVGGTESTVSGQTTSTAGGGATTTAGGTATGGNATTSTGQASTSTTGGTSLNTSTTTPAAPNTWMNLDPSGSRPSSRERDAMVYDPDLGKANLFGGWHGGSLGETWAYDPASNTWASLNPSSDLPSERMGHAMVYDPVGRKVILFGGHSGLDDLNDTWAYDPATNQWTNLNPAGTLPPVRSLHTMFYDSGTKKVILFGGWNGAVLGDLWAYDPAANTWKELHPSRAQPPARSGHSMVYDSDTGKAILFGGMGEGDVLLNDTWVYTPKANTWNQIKPAGDLPPARGAASMVYDLGTGTVILFGGGLKGVDGGDFNDVWSYDPAANSWTELNPGNGAPSVRWGSSIIYYPASDKVIVFGGMGNFTYYDETWGFTAKP
jgi:N-acetylneuraminic acid mutarotase